MAEIKNQQSNQNANSQKYNDYVNHVCPPDKIIEWLTNYYGEDKKDYIASVIKNTPVIFIPGNTNLQDMIIACKKAYPDISVHELIDHVQTLENVLRELVEFDGIIPGDIMDKEMKVLKELGFEPSKILLKNKEKNMYKLAQNEETKRLKNYFNFSINKSEINNNVFNMNSFVDAYNKIASRDQPAYVGIHATKFGDKYSFREYGLWQNGDKKFSPGQSKIEISNLSEEDKQLLLDFINLPSLMRVDNEEYIVNGLNKIFNKNHKSIRDIRNDESLALLLSLKNNIKKTLKNAIFESNINKEDFIPVNNPEAKKVLDRQLNDLVNGYNAAGSYCAKAKSLQFVLDSSGFSMSLGLILHEYNHAISDCLGTCGFGDFYGWEFNEIVNEYLTQQAISKISNQDKSEWIGDVNPDSLYNTGVNFMKGFLDAYEEKLKECQLGDAEKILSDFIGVENFEALVQIGAEIGNKKFSFFLTNIEWKGRQISNISEFIEIYKTDPEIIKSLPEEHQITLTYFIQANKFLEDLVAHHKDFEQKKNVEITKPTPLLDMAQEFYASKEQVKTQ